MRSTSENWKGATPVFILTIEWAGQTYRASTEAITVPSSTGSDILFCGGLVEDPAFNFELPEFGFQVSSYSTPIAVYLNGVDISEQASRHNHMDDAYCELDYVLVKNGLVGSYEDRFALVHGYVKQPIFGHHDKPKCYVEFSLENPIVSSSAYALSVGKTAQIASKELSSIINTSLSPLNSIYIAGTTLIDVVGVHKGKNIPFVFGDAGTYIDDQNTLQKFGATPAYVIYATSGGANKIWLAISAHDVDAPNVRIFDDLGNNRLENVQKFISRSGSVFCFVEFTHSSGGFQNPVDDENAKYFCCWEQGGGYRSPLTNAPISNAGDLCLYFLSLGNQQVDYASWNSIRTLLNGYQFSGYINNTELSPLEFIQNEIVPFLPISIIQSNEGLKPIYNVLASGSALLSTETIIASPEFALNGAITTTGDTANVINDYSLEYTFDPHQNEHKKTMRITGITTDLYENVFSNQQAVNSFQRFGQRSVIEKSNYIHDQATASKVCEDTIKFNSIPDQIVSYIAGAKYGYLEVGEIITLSDNDINFDKRLVQVIMKSWEDTHWLYTLKVSPEGYQQ